MESWPFRVVRGKDDRPMVEVTFRKERRSFCAEELSGMVLGKLKRVAESYLSVPVKGHSHHCACLLQ